MTAEEFGGVVRALLSAAGGILVAKGTLDHGTATAVAGAGAIVATAVWSTKSKRKRRKKADM